MLNARLHNMSNNSFLTTRILERRVGDPRMDATPEKMRLRTRCGETAPAKPVIAAHIL